MGRAQRNPSTPVATKMMGIASLQPSYEANGFRRRRSLQIVLLLLLAVAQALRDRGSPWDQRGFIG